MKKLFSLLLAALLIFSLTGCDKNKKNYEYLESIGYTTENSKCDRMVNDILKEYADGNIKYSDSFTEMPESFVLPENLFPLKYKQVGDMFYTVFYSDDGKYTVGIDMAVEPLRDSDGLPEIVPLEITGVRFYNNTD